MKHHVSLCIDFADHQRMMKWNNLHRKTWKFWRNYWAKNTNMYLQSIHWYFLTNIKMLNRICKFNWNAKFQIITKILRVFCRSTHHMFVCYSYVSMYTWFHGSIEYSIQTQVRNPLIYYSSFFARIIQDLYLREISLDSLVITSFYVFLYLRTFLIYKRNGKFTALFRKSKEWRPCEEIWRVRKEQLLAVGLEAQWVKSSN